VFILNYKGKYFLDEIDNDIFSTDSFELYNLYNKIFFNIPIKNHVPIDKPVLESEANRETWLKALEQEKAFYENGYVYESKLYRIRGKTWKKGRWVKDSLKAALILEAIKKRHGVD